jgi:hypothetical protein
MDEQVSNAVSQLNNVVAEAAINIVDKDNNGKIDNIQSILSEIKSRLDVNHDKKINKQDIIAFFSDKTVNTIMILAFTKIIGIVFMVLMIGFITKIYDWNNCLIGIYLAAIDFSIALIYKLNGKDISNLINK